MAWKQDHKRKMREYMQKWRTENKDRVKKLQRESYQRCYQRRFSTLDRHCRNVLSSAKQRSKKRDLNFDLTLEFLISLWHSQEGQCALTGLKMDLEKGKGYNYLSPSLDKIEPSLGYIQYNVRFVCHQANTMKNNLSDKELKDWCLLLIKGLEND